MGGQRIARPWLKIRRDHDEKKYREQDRRPGIGTGAGGLFGARGLGGSGEPEGGGQLTGVTVTPSNLSMKVGSGPL